MTKLLKNGNKKFRNRSTFFTTNHTKYFASPRENGMRIENG
jgi:hypothetical protein